MHKDRPAPSSTYVLVQVTGLVLFLLFSLALASTARAAEQPSDFVSRIGHQATAIITDANLSRGDRQRAFQHMLHDYFDVELIGRFVLGRHWRSATPDERRAFLATFEAYVLTTYSRKLESYAGETLEVGRAQDKGRHGVIVPSVLHRPQGAPLTVHWRLRQVGDSWRVFDIVVEGVSMVVTHRNEIDTVLRQSGGFAGLLDSLRAMLARIGGPEAIQASKL